MKGNLLTAIADRLRTIERLLDKIDRSVERIEIVTVVREPNTSLSADAYNGLRKQVIAAVGERNAHIHQLTKFDSALRAGASAEELAGLVREWLGQASIELSEDTTVAAAFDFVGPVEATECRVLRPAYVDAVTRRIVQPGIAERFVVPAPADAGARKTKHAAAAINGRAEHVVEAPPVADAQPPDETPSPSGGKQ